MNIEKSGSRGICIHRSHVGHIHILKEFAGLLSQHFLIVSKAYVRSE